MAGVDEPERRRPDRARIDDELSERLDKFTKEYRRYAARNAAAIRRWSRRTIAILAVIALGMIGIGVATLYLLDENSRRADEVQREGVRRADEIQRERVAAIRQACDEQNRRHDATIRRLDRLLVHIVNTRERARARANRAGTVSLINALSPHRDCARVVRASVPSAS